MCVRCAAIFITPYVSGHTCEPMKPMMGIHSKDKKKVRKSKLRSGPGCMCYHVIPFVFTLLHNPFCVYIIIGHNNQIFIKKSCGPAWLCPDNAFRVTALVTVGGAIAGVHRPGRSADSESESACQAGLTPSQHASAELVTRTRVTVAARCWPRQYRSLSVGATVRLRRQAPGSRAGAWWPKLGT